MVYYAYIRSFVYRIFIFALVLVLILPMYSVAKASVCTVSDSLFPSVTFYGVITKKYENLRVNERVRIFYSIHEKYYVVIKNDKEYRVEWADLQPEWNPLPSVPPVSDIEIETYINSKNIKSNTGFLAWADLARCRTYFFKEESRTWKLINKADCSMGDPQHPTPRGFFEVIFKSPFIGDEDEWYICKNAVCFYKSFMFHSVPFAWTGKYITDSRTTGAISHGCLRFSVKDSKWIYDNILECTKVWIN